MEKKTYKILMRVLKDHRKNLKAMKKDKNFIKEADNNPKLLKHLDSTLDDVDFLIEEFK